MGIVSFLTSFVRPRKNRDAPKPSSTGGGNSGVPSGRATIESVLPWRAWGETSRCFSPSPLNDSNIWLAHFTTGNAVPHDVRLAGAEYGGGGPIPRHAVLTRDRDGAVLDSVSGTSPTFWMTFDAKQAGGIFASQKAVLEPQTAYTISIWNDPGHGSGSMFLDLYI